MVLHADAMIKIRYISIVLILALPVFLSSRRYYCRYTVCAVAVSPIRYEIPTMDAAISGSLLLTEPPALPGPPSPNSSCRSGMPQHRGPTP